MGKFWNSMRTKTAAFIIVAVMAAVSLYQGNEAIKLARQVDNEGDIRACTQENLIRAQSNERDEKLETTARLMAEALIVISESDREAGDPTNAKLEAIIKRAATVQAGFLPAPMTDCEKQFPKP